MTDDKDFKRFVRDEARLHGDSYQRMLQQFRRQAVSHSAEVEAILVSELGRATTLSGAARQVGERVAGVALRIADGKATVTSFGIPKELHVLNQQVLDAEFHASHVDPSETSRRSAEGLRSDYERKLAEHREIRPETTATEVLVQLSGSNRNALLSAILHCLELLEMSPADDVAGRAVLADAFASVHVTRES